MSWIEKCLRLSTFFDQISSSSSTKTRFGEVERLGKNYTFTIRPEFLAQCAWHLCERLSENQFVTKSTTGREIVEFRHRKPPLWICIICILCICIWLKPLREELRCVTLRFNFQFIKSFFLSLSVAYSGEAGHGPLASGPRKCRNAVGGLCKTLEKGPKR